MTIVALVTVVIVVIKVTAVKEAAVVTVEIVTFKQFIGHTNIYDIYVSVAL